MRENRLLAAVLSVSLATMPASGQVRTIALTGRPAATLPEPISSISFGTELSSGRFVFVDRAEKVVRLTDEGFARLQQLSRTGSGPGEYRMPTRAMSDGSGGAVVPDEMLGRAILVAGDGAIVGTGLDRSVTGRSAVTIRGFDRAGRVYRFGAHGDGQDSLVIERWDPASRKVEQLAMWPQIPAVAGPTKKLPGGGTRTEIGMSSLFPSRMEWVPLENGSLAMVYPQPYRVEVVTPQGRRIRGNAVRYQPVKVTRAYREWFATERGPTPESMFPDVLPPFEDAGSVISSPQNEVWVRRLSDWNDTIPRYDIFDERGKLTATAQLNRDSKVVGFGKEAVYVARESSQDGFWYLEKFALRR